MNKIIAAFIVLFLISAPCFADIPTEKPEVHLNYNYESTTKIPIKMQITENIKDENHVYEGQPVNFRVVRDIF